MIKGKSFMRTFHFTKRSDVHPIGKKQGVLLKISGNNMCANPAADWANLSLFLKKARIRAVNFEYFIASDPQIDPQILCWCRGC